MNASTTCNPARKNSFTGFQRLIPRLEESFDDCGYLFDKFKEHMKKKGHAGIVVINFDRETEPPATTARTIALFIRIMGKKLSGRIEGGYKAGAGEFFLLLVPEDAYREEDFHADMDTIRQELRRYFTLPHVVRKGDFPPMHMSMTIDGVFLTNHDGEKADNVLFKAFQQLFNASALPSRAKSAAQMEIEEIISEGRLTPVYQPIFSLTDGLVHGYEALSRLTKHGIFNNPDDLFERSGEFGLTSALEMLCRKKALVGAKEMQIPGRIFLNVCPTVLQESGHERGFTATLLEELGIERSRVTFELTERTMIEDYDLFNRVLSYYREQGYSIAIDDLGAGYAGLRMLAQLEPDYVKLARFLIVDIHQSNTKQALVEALVKFCDRIGAQVIAEGIEKPEELEYLISAGVSFGQGYLLAKPSSSPLSPGYCYMHK